MRDFPSHAERKTAQLCKQVLRVVGSVLSEHADDELSGLSLLHVEPAAGPSVLRVILVAPNASGESLAAAREALEKLRPELRMEVAQSVNRKRAPELVFSVVPA